MQEHPLAWKDVLKKLEAYYGKTNADKWAVTPNPQLGGRTPEDAWKTDAGRAQVRELVNENGDKFFI